MEFFVRLGTLLSDRRLGMHLIVAHGLVTAVVLASLLIRSFVLRGGSRLMRLTGLRWLEAVGDEAVRHGRRVLFWLTLGAIAFIALGTGVYHFVGRDIRIDLQDAYDRLSTGELLALGINALILLAIAMGSWFAVRMVRRLRPLLERQVTPWVQRPGNGTALRRWFALLHCYLVLAVRLVAAWAAFKVVGLDRFADAVFGFLLRVLTILQVAQLLTLTCRIFSQTLADLGERRSQTGPFRHYWERITRLFPFGEKCFDAAVYVKAATLCALQLRVIAGDAVYGTMIVKCIAIFFVTRVLIELIQVLLGEAFGLYNDELVVDQKGQTLVPLLNSIVQYVLYFGSALIMLGEFNVDTKPILAGAGILGLAVGLGAQTLVSDIVSGFFILFENQYLVGDYVQIGDASGRVEAVGIRVTQIRDGQGKLYIIPNGQIKGVVSYSKGYVNALIDLRVPSGSDLEAVFRAMAEAGRRLRHARSEVLAETQIHGLVDLGTSEMTVRAVTKVKPGTHTYMQNEYRRLLKQVMDEDNGRRPASLAA